MSLTSFCSVSYMRGERQFIAGIPWALLGLSHTCKFYISCLCSPEKKNALKVASLYHSIVKGEGSELLVYYNFFVKCKIKLPVFAL